MPRSTWDTSRVLSDFAYWTFTVFGVPSQTLLLSVHNPTLRSRNPPTCTPKFSLFPFRSPLLGESLTVSIPEATEMFQFASFAYLTYVFSKVYPGMNQGGLPHSEISGSKPVCDSPKHIAAYHVLHRLSLPSHSS